LLWSDREVFVDPNDPADLAKAIVNWALDHSYDRGDQLPCGLRKDLSEAILPVVGRHLSAINRDWKGRTIYMDKESTGRFLSDVEAAIKAAILPVVGRHLEAAKAGVAT